MQTFPKYDVEWDHPHLVNVCVKAILLYLLRLLDAGRRRIRENQLDYDDHDGDDDGGGVIVAVDGERRLGAVDGDEWSGDMQLLQQQLPLSPPDGFRQTRRA